MTSAGGRPIRSALLVHRFPPDFAGGGIQASRLMRHLAARGLSHTALTGLPPGHDAATDEAAFGGRVIRFRVPSHPWANDIGVSLRAAWWLLRSDDWDLLHISGFSYFAVLPLWVAKLRGKPVLIKTTVLGHNGAFNPGGSALSRAILSAWTRADAVVALSKAIEEHLEAEPRLQGRIVPLPNGVDTELFHPATPEERDAARDAWDLPRDAFVIVSSSMLYIRKNPISLVRAAGRISDRRICLAMAGPPAADPAYMRALETAIAELPPHVSVRLLGRLEPPRLAELLRAGDAFALVSFWEGLPNALLEGMATGLPCVATDIPGSRDVLEHGGGRLVPPDDDAALAAVLEDFASDPPGAWRLGADARKLIEDGYALDVVAERYHRLYESLLAR